jgi:hypothetical protein
MRTLTMITLPHKTQDLTLYPYIRPYTAGLFLLGTTMLDDHMA